MTTAEDWAGRVGREWAAQDAALDGLLGPAGALGLARLAVRPGERVLDLGCGSGRTSAALAAAGAVVTGIDLSPDLLALARARPGAEAVAFREEDSAAARFAEPFDALFSRCGAMFFGDPPAAWAHLRAAMVPGGRLVAVAWGPAARNVWATLPLAAAEPVLGGAARAAIPAGPGPFAWAEPAAFAPVLAGAGWREVAWEGAETVARLGAGEEADPVARAVAFALRIGPLASRLRGFGEREKGAVARLLAESFAAHVRGGAVELPAFAWIVTARA